MVKQSDIIKISFDPTVGSEQAGYRPAVVVSNDFVISKTNIITLCPITGGQGKSALNVILDERTEIQGAVLCAHSKAVDLSVRPYKVVGQMPKDKLNEVLEILISTIKPS